MLLIVSRTERRNHPNLLGISEASPNADNVVGCVESTSRRPGDRQASRAYFMALIEQGIRGRLADADRLVPITGSAWIRRDDHGAA
jgi:hypothetical protein